MPVLRLILWALLMKNRGVVIPTIIISAGFVDYYSNAKSKSEDIIKLKALYAEKAVK